MQEDKIEPVFRLLSPVFSHPMTPIVEAFRYAFLGAGSFNPMNLLYSFGFMLVVVIIGTVIFNRVEATFMDTV
jgi:lipopolysaccharide transport system permease protein